MPFLEAEKTIYPDNLFDGFCDEPSDRRWWAVYTKARQEKSLARELLKFNIPFFLPLGQRDHLVRGKRRRSFPPLFQGYLFLYAAEPERVRCLTTNRVSRVLSVTAQDEMEHDLRQLHRVLDLNDVVQLERRPQPGQKVRVVGGAMMGVEGTVLSLRGKSRLVIQVRFLDQGVSLEVDDYLLERLG